jgi:putative endonuclease
MTGNLQQRVEQHKSKEIDGFTKRYKIDRLVFYEMHHTATATIAREKQIKGWTRAKKIALIEENNPGWHDRT